jgi:hypothetical protein
VAATRLKKLRYNTAIELAAAQLRAGKRPSMPRLVPGIITHSGELGPDMIGMIEALTKTFASQHRKGPHTRGLSKSKHTAIFRTKLKDGLLAANAEGFGQALIAAGNPITGWVIAPDDFVWDGTDSWDVNNY